MKCLSGVCVHPRRRRTWLLCKRGCRVSLWSTTVVLKQTCVWLHCSPNRAALLTVSGQQQHGQQAGFLQPSFFWEDSSWSQRRWTRRRGGWERPPQTTSELATHSQILKWPFLIFSKVCKVNSFYRSSATGVVDDLIWGEWLNICWMYHQPVWKNWTVRSFCEWGWAFGGTPKQELWRHTFL